MAETRYTADHEWVRLEDDGTLTIGITDHAQEALGDIVFIELPQTAPRSRRGRILRHGRKHQGRQ